MIEIEVVGTPAPKGSMRAFFNKKLGRAFITQGGKGDDGSRKRAWEVAVRQHAVEAIVALGDAAPSGPVFVQRPLRVSLIFRIARPGSHWAKRGGLKPSAPIAPAVKPDIDKLARSTLDALIGLVFDDDSRIVRLSLAKEYAKAGQQGARIVVEEWKSA